MDIYLIFVVVLLILAVSDLIVGISNDAANFINSAVGSGVAKVRTILFIAALGVLAGATFSSGMMEIARSGVFYPEKFYFSEIMIIFLAVMITDVILLDTFNTFGFPTSTTVSIVFELLGASVAVSLIKIIDTSGTISDLSSYINTGKALAIISGILLSVVLAFSFGTIVQFLTRLLFTFNYSRNLKYFGALWGGLATTAIIYFMLVKGAKGASFMTPGAVDWLNTHTFELLLISFTGLTILLQLLISLFNINILKIIVLTGTFSLAMAFAGNDLVNFIGVPLAGFDSFIHIKADPSASPDTMLMDVLNAPVRTPTFMLLAAGMIMVLTLFFSKKARTVSQTEINLARQGEGNERFSSSAISRSVVGTTIMVSKLAGKLLPDRFLRFLEIRFDYKAQQASIETTDATKSSFDLLRASVNMFVASMLIAAGTSLKLPLSTTYVTFMVAMGTSLADRAWGRESAVYRITGVVAVIGGWFFTAVIAFSATLGVALFLSWGGTIAIILALALALFFIIRSHSKHRKILQKQSGKDEFADADTLTGLNILQKCSRSVTEITGTASKLYFSTVLNLIKEDRKKMRKKLDEVNELNQRTKELKNNLYPTLKKLEEEYIETGHFYVQVLDYQREIAHCLKYIADPVFEQLDNHHPPLRKEQVRDLHELNESVASFFDEINAIFRKDDFRNIEKLLSIQNEVVDSIAKTKKKQIRLIKEDLIGTRSALMILNLLAETKNLVLYSVNMIKSYRDFIHGEEDRNRIK
ncbi:MAG: inorganic phosphate transporter [Bacteroidales bacterium]|jgi:phosphate/sulfate permease|nr:inorganic phosphate transporter [Bacteroidales bacterium]